MSEDPHFVGKGELRNPLRRAALSVGNNMAEGFERGTTQELLTFLYIDHGSGGEVRSMLLPAERMACFTDRKSENSNLKSVAESIARQLRGWADSPRNSTIKEQRYLNEQTRRQDQHRRRTALFWEKLEQEHGRRLEIPKGSP